nr:DUF2683 family protein [uncultured Pedobacter sp.]
MEAINIKAFTTDSSQLEALKAVMKALKIKFEVSNEDIYNKEFVKKIEESRKQIAEGKVTKISLDDIWK